MKIWHQLKYLDPQCFRLMSILRWWCCCVDSLFIVAPIFAEALCLSRFIAMALLKLHDGGSGLRLNDGSDVMF